MWSAQPIVPFFASYIALVNNTNLTVEEAIGPMVTQSSYNILVRQPPTPKNFLAVDPERTKRPMICLLALLGTCSQFSGRQGKSLCDERP
jgi:hypothetical protein